MITDNGNYLVNRWFRAGIFEPCVLAHTLADSPGIGEHGRLLGMATDAVVADAAGIRVLHR